MKLGHAEKMFWPVHILAVIMFVVLWNYGNLSYLWLLALRAGPFELRLEAMVDA